MIREICSGVKSFSEDEDGGEEEGWKYAGVSDKTSFSAGTLFGTLWSVQKAWKRYAKAVVYTSAGKADFMYVRARMGCL